MKQMELCIIDLWWRTECLLCMILSNTLGICFTINRKLMKRLAHILADTYHLAHRHTSFHRLVQEGSNLSSVVNNAISFVSYHTSYPLLCPSFSERPCRFCYEMVIIKKNNIWTRTLIQKKHTHTFIGSRKMNKIRQNLSSPYIKHRERSVR